MDMSANQLLGRRTRAAQNKAVKNMSVDEIVEECKVWENIIKSQEIITISSESSDSSCAPKKRRVSNGSKKIEMSSKYVADKGETPQETRKSVYRKWSEIIMNGLPKDSRDKCYQEYRLSEGYKFLRARPINPKYENENIMKSDQAEIYNQTRVAAVIIAIDRAFSSILHHDEDSKEKFERMVWLVDAGTILADLYHSIATKRDRELAIYNVGQGKFKETPKEKQSDLRTEEKKESSAGMNKGQSRVGNVGIEKVSGSKVEKERNAEEKMKKKKSTEGTINKEKNAGGRLAKEKQANKKNEEETNAEEHVVKIKTAEGTMEKEKHVDERMRKEKQGDERKKEERNAEENSEKIKKAEGTMGKDKNADERTTKEKQADERKEIEKNAEEKVKKIKTVEGTMEKERHVDERMTKEKQADERKKEERNAEENSEKIKKAEGTMGKDKNTDERTMKEKQVDERKEEEKNAEENIGKDKCTGKTIIDKDSNDKRNEEETGAEKIEKESVSKNEFLPKTEDVEMLFRVCRLINTATLQNDGDIKFTLPFMPKAEIKKTTNTPPPGEPFPGISEMVKRAYLARGVPTGAIDSILHNCAPRTWYQYEKTARFWWDFCKLHTNVDVYDAEIQQIFDFLVHHEGVIGSVSAMATWRAAMSRFTRHDLAKHKELSEYIKGFKNLKTEKK